MTRLLMGAREEHGVETPAQLRQRFDAWTARNRLKRPIVPTDETLVPYVSAGRWVADCPQCGSGVAIERDWPEAICFGCGQLYTSFDWPAPGDLDEIERVLRARPHVSSRTWLRRGHPALGRLDAADPRRARGETVEDLRIENAAHGLPARFETAREREARRERP